MIRRLKSPSDPDLPLICPTCGLPLEYLHTNAKKPVFRGSAIIEWEYAHVYRCPRHGRFRLDSEGVKPEPM